MKIEKVDRENYEVVIKFGFIEFYVICSAVEKLGDRFRDINKERGLENAIGYLMSYAGSSFITPKWYSQTIEKKGFNEFEDEIYEMYRILR